MGDGEKTKHIMGVLEGGHPKLVIPHKRGGRPS